METYAQERAYTPQAILPTKYCLYARKSTEQDELQALSIDSQIKEMLDMASKEGLNVVEIKKESHSAKDSGQRPVYQELIADIKLGKFNGIIAWDPSRISRNAGDLGQIVDLMDQGRIIDIRTHGQRFTNSPNEKFLLMILCSQAKLENDHKGENVKRGLRAKCEQGYRPGLCPLGYMFDPNGKKGSKKIFVDEERAPIMKQMFEKVAYEDVSGRDLYNWFVKIGFRTRTGEKVALSAIYRALKDTFYYGEFEYPIGQGKWYKGGYEPIITKDLYLKAQANLISPPRKHPGTNEFEFTKLFRCGACGSGISAEEKFKRNKNGNVHRYVYYHCSHGSDRNCKQGAMREENLLEQLLRIIDKIDIDQLSAEKKIRAEIDKHRKFVYMMLGKESDLDKNPTEADVRTYAKYILSDGTKDQKREILGCFRNSIAIMDQKVVLQNEDL